MRGRELKEIIAANIKDEDLVCIGEKKDYLGRFDKQIIGIETRQVGFDDNNTYKVIVSEPFESNGAMKFW